MRRLLAAILASLLSVSSVLAATGNVQWGTSTDIPVPGDYDGDGSTDIAVFRPSNGVWYVHGGTSAQWGTTGDIPVPADYDGNGTTDMAVFRPSNGVWYIRNGTSAQWGASGDVPVPADYDGDGDIDLTVFRPSDGTWYIKPPPPEPIAHVVVVWMENKEASQITASSMPYLYGLSTTYGRATQVYGVTHPSQPNYIAFWSGSTQGVTTNANVDLTADNLSSQLTTAGKEWREYAQNVPANCYTGATSTGGIDGPGVAGTYARKHAPAISFTSVSGSPTECAKIQPLASFDPTVAEVAFVAPNLCNDMHDCSLAVGDAFLQGFLPSVFNSPEWAQTLLIVTFDEGTSNINGGGNIFTLVARQGLSGVTSSTFHNHYGVLRTIEDIFGLPCLGSACSATPLTEFLP